MGEKCYIVGVENVWNKFLLSPLEFAGYADECASPWLRAYFDVGNIIIYGYAQDWTRTIFVESSFLDSNRSAIRDFPQ